MSHSGCPDWWMQTFTCLSMESAWTSMFPAQVPSRRMRRQYASKGSSSSTKGS